MTELSILIVDDDDGDRKMLRRCLRRVQREITIEEARSTDELHDIQTGHLDAIFLDYFLPGASGLNVLTAVRSRWPQAAVFMVTGQGDEHLAKSAIKLGATDYISKSDISGQSLNQTLIAGIDAARAQWKLDEQRRDLATFSEVLVHDFKAPIRAVAFLVEQIDEDLEAGDMDEVQDSLRLLKNASRNMLETIKSLSDHIRFDREDAFTETTAAELCDRAVGALNRDILETGAMLIRELPQPDGEILCRAPQIAQVLQNLIANAVKYSGDDPARIVVRHKRRATSHLFEVEDHGIGIEKDQIDRVFEPFKRAPGMHAISGTGLGLATCKKIVMRHGGRIWCRSQIGAGTVMAFELPIPQSPSDAMGDAAPARSLHPIDAG